MKSCVAAGHSLGNEQKEVKSSIDNLTQYITVLCCKYLFTLT